MVADRTEPPIETDTAAGHCKTVQTELAETVISTDEFLQTVLTGIIAGEHVLLEDVPGTGKTLTARSIARTLGLDFSRIQFTPDLLPSDITGSNVYDEQAGAFRFSEGPVFANIILADEINRAPPKTQAALLEAMEERQVSVADSTHNLPDPFSPPPDAESS
jgi:MoxR-like ATPases